MAALASHLLLDHTLGVDHPPIDLQGALGGLLPPVLARASMAMVYILVETRTLSSSLLSTCIAAYVDLRLA